MGLWDLKRESWINSPPPRPLPEVPAPSRQSSQPNAPSPACPAPCPAPWCPLTTSPALTSGAIPSPPALGASPLGGIPATRCASPVYIPRYFPSLLALYSRWNSCIAYQQRGIACIWRDLGVKRALVTGERGGKAEGGGCIQPTATLSPIACSLFSMQSQQLMLLP